MKVIILVSAIVFSGCYSNAKCVDGIVYYNIHPFSMDNIYQKTERECEVI